MRGLFKDSDALSETLHGCYFIYVTSRLAHFVDHCISLKSYLDSFYVAGLPQNEPCPAYKGDQILLLLAQG